MNLNIELNNILNMGEKDTPLHLELRPITLLIGANGTGKSTFINLIDKIINQKVDNEIGLIFDGDDSDENIRIKNDLIDYTYNFNQNTIGNSINLYDNLNLTSINKQNQSIEYVYETIKYSQNLKAKEYYNKIQDKDEYYLFSTQNVIYDLEFLNKKLKEVGIADEIIIEKKEDLIFVSLRRENKVLALNQIPRGYQKILFLILTLTTKVIQEGDVVSDKDNNLLQQTINPIICVEEPEANLHPNLQAKLVELLNFPFEVENFIKDKHKNSKFKYYPILLIETHSEYLIRSYQREVAKGNIDSKDICILYFDQNNEDKILPRMIEIDRNGFLSDDFGKGFMDEASSLIHDLRKIRMENKN